VITRARSPYRFFPVTLGKAPDIPCLLGRVGYAGEDGVRPHGPAACVLSRIRYLPRLAIGTNLLGQQGDRL
jgi:hypothetical protein